MAKHVCGCGCGGFNMCCLNCPLRKIFQPVQCRKERQQPKFNTNEKHLLKKTIRSYLKGNNNENQVFYLHLLLLYKTGIS